MNGKHASFSTSAEALEFLDRSFQEDIAAISPRDLIGGSLMVYLPPDEELLKPPFITNTQNLTDEIRSYFLSFHKINAQGLTKALQKSGMFDAVVIDRASNYRVTAKASGYRYILVLDINVKLVDLYSRSDRDVIYKTLPEFLDSVENAVRSMPTAAKPPTSAVAPDDKSASNLPKPIIAVFDVFDASGKFEKNILIQLTTYLGTALTTFGKFKVVPRDQLRSRLLDEKKGSYRKCMDESCQIELGKVVAAQKSLATQLLNVGGKCAVTANLFDLKTETTEKGAMVNTGCSPDELLDAIKQIAEQLSGK
jgi:hypothetical protein